MNDALIVWINLTLSAAFLASDDAVGFNTVSYAVMTCWRVALSVETIITRAVTRIKISGE